MGAGRSAWRVTLGVSLMLMLWLILSEAQIISGLFLAGPLSTANAALDLLKSGRAFYVAAVSLSRVFFALIFGGGMGVAMGLILGTYPSLYSLFEVQIDFFRSIPTAALFPLFLVIFGIGNPAKLATATWAVFLLVLVGTMYGVKTVKQIRLDVCKVLGATRLQVFWYLTVRESMPHIFSALRLSVSLSLVVTVMTEMFFGTKTGLGHEIYNASLVFAVPELYAWILITGVVGYALNKGVVIIERKVIHWVGK